MHYGAMSDLAWDPAVTYEEADGCNKSRPQHGVLSHQALSRLEEVMHTSLSFRGARNAAATNVAMQ
jgi:hypothetical protein